MVEGLSQFKYLGRPLDQMDYNWSAVNWNTKQAHMVWGRLVNILQREGAHTKLVAMFYWVVVQALLLFGSESWFLSSAMEKMAKGAHTGFLYHIAGKRERQITCSIWMTPAKEQVLEAAETKSAATYIGRR